MLCTRARGIFDHLKNFWSPGGIWYKFLVPQCNPLKGFGTPTTELKIIQKVFAPLLQFYNSFRTSHNEQQQEQQQKIQTF